MTEQEVSTVTPDPTCGVPSTSENIEMNPTKSSPCRTPATTRTSLTGSGLFSTPGDNTTSSSHSHHIEIQERLFQWESQKIASLLQKHPALPDEDVAKVARALKNAAFHFSTASTHSNGNLDFFDNVLDRVATGGGVKSSKEVPSLRLPSDNLSLPELVGALASRSKTIITRQQAEIHCLRFAVKELMGQLLQVETSKQTGKEDRGPPNVIEIQDGYGSEDGITPLRETKPTGCSLTEGMETSRSSPVSPSTNQLKSVTPSPSHQDGQTGAKQELPPRPLHSSDDLDTSKSLRCPSRALPSASPDSPQWDQVQGYLVTTSRSTAAPLEPETPNLPQCPPEEEADHYDCSKSVPRSLDERMQVAGKTEDIKCAITSGTVEDKPVNPVEIPKLPQCPPDDEADHYDGLKSVARSLDKRMLDAGRTEDIKCTITSGTVENKPVNPPETPNLPQCPPEEEADHCDCLKSVSRSLDERMQVAGKTEDIKCAITNGTVEDKPVNPVETPKLPQCPPDDEADHYDGLKPVARSLDERMQVAGKTEDMKNTITSGTVEDKPVNPPETDLEEKATESDTAVPEGPIIGMTEGAKIVHDVIEEMIEMATQEETPQHQGAHTEIADSSIDEDAHSCMPADTCATEPLNQPKPVDDAETQAGILRAFPEGEKIIPSGESAVVPSPNTGVTKALNQTDRGDVPETSIQSVKDFWAVKTSTRRPCEESAARKIFVSPSKNSRSTNEVKQINSSSAQTIRDREGETAMGVPESSTITRPLNESEPANDIQLHAVLSRASTESEEIVPSAATATSTPSHYGDPMNSLSWDGNEGGAEKSLQAVKNFWTAKTSPRRPIHESTAPTFLSQSTGDTKSTIDVTHVDASSSQSIDHKKVEMAREIFRSAEGSAVGDDGEPLREATNEDEEGDATGQSVESVTDFWSAWFSRLANDMESLDRLTSPPGTETDQKNDGRKVDRTSFTTCLRGTANVINTTDGEHETSRKVTFNGDVIVRSVPSREDDTMAQASSSVFFPPTASIFIYGDETPGGEEKKDDAKARDAEILLGNKDRSEQMTTSANVEIQALKEPASTRCTPPSPIAKIEEVLLTQQLLRKGRRHPADKGDDRPDRPHRPPTRRMLETFPKPAETGKFRLPDNVMPTMIMREDEFMLMDAPQQMSTVVCQPDESLLGYFPSALDTSMDTEGTPDELLASICTADSGSAIEPFVDTYDL